MAAKSNAPDSDAVASNARRLAELAALVDAVKERVRAQYPESSGTAAAGAICVGLPDLTPLARARDAAAGKMAAIGTVNPRPGGLVNNSIQSLKRAVSRALNWFVRDQVVFNRQMIACVEACIEALADANRTIHNLAGQANTEIQKVRAEAEPLRVEARTLRAKTSDLQDLASHWHRWREEWQLKLHKNEVEFLKSVADLNQSVQQKILHLEGASQQRITGAEQSMQELHRAYERSVDNLQSGYERQLRDMHGALDAVFRKAATELDASYRQTALQLEASCQQTAAGIQATFERTVASFEQRISDLTAQFDLRTAASLREQHDDFDHLANSNAEAIQRSVAEQITALDQRLDRIRTEYERIIHAELRVVRQRLGSAVVPPAVQMKPVDDVLPFDYARFADRFRGSEQYVTEAQRFYVPYFAGRRHVLDIGCGRGEFLRLLKDAGVPASGIEASDESVASCRSQGLDAAKAELFEYLSEQPEATLDGIFCLQVVEHLSAGRLPEMVRLCAGRLVTGGILAIETPNPECLAIFGTHFYLDPTHTRPVPSQLLAFYMEESGLGRIEVHQRAPAIESMPEVGELPEGFRKKFFDGLDYAIIAYKL